MMRVKVSSFLWSTLLALMWLPAGAEAEIIINEFYSYTPDFIEIRAADGEDKKVGETTAALGESFSPVADPEVTAAPGMSEGSVQFVLPCVDKTDLELFFTSRDAYDTLDWEEKLSNHSWLLDLGVMMSEPAIRFDGMAGECLWGCACWVVVPYDQMRGDALPPATRKEILEEGISMMTKTVVPTPA